MPAKANLTKSANIDVTAREVDFVSRFQDYWQGLMEILSVTRPIRKTPGTVLKAKVGSVTLQTDPVGEGEEIPYSLGEVEEVGFDPITIEKYCKAVSIEAINDHGYEYAVQKTDDAYLAELQGIVMDRFYDFLQTGLLTGSYDTFQMALAMARGKVLNKFKGMKKAVTEVVAFVNLNDFYAYLGSTPIDEQSLFGLTYVENFMGYRTVFLCSDNEIPQGKVIAVPRENVVCYYVDPADSDFARSGLSFTTVGMTNLIGSHIEGAYRTMVSENYVIMGITLFAEYLDGIAVISFGADSE